MPNGSAIASSTITPTSSPRCPSACASGSPWLRALVDGHVVRVTEGVTVTRIDADAAIGLALSDGSEREVDYVLLGTGYRFVLGADFSARRVGQALRA